MGPAWAILGELFPPSVLGKVFGFYNMTCFIGGVLGPYLTGVIHDATGSFAAGLYAAAVGCLVARSSPWPCARRGGSRRSPRL